MYVPRPLALMAALLTTLFLICLRPVAAQTKATPAAMPAASTTAEESMAQINGMTSGVVDELWDITDFYWHKGDYQRIIAILRVCVEADPTFTDAYSNGAWLIWSLGDTKAADDFLQHGIANAPTKTAKSELYFDLGWHVYNTKRYKEALPYLQNAVKAGTNNRVAYTTLAHTYRHLKRYNEALQVWNTVEKKYPDFAAAKSNKARIQALIQGKAR